MSYVSLVLGELVPKRLALQRPEAIARFVAPMLNWIARVSRPVIWLLSVSTNAVVRLLGIDPHAKAEISQLGRTPDVEDSAEALGHRFTVTEMDERRVARVRITPIDDHIDAGAERA